jgi:hypothetical protein
VGGVRNAYNILVGKPEGNRTFEDLAEDGRTVLDLKEPGCKDVDWIHIAQNRVQ